MKEDE